MSLGKGALIAMSTKQKLNTTSSTEAELVGVSDSRPFNMWATYFFKAQGEGVTDYKLFGIYCIKITSRVSSLQIMARHPAPNGLDISTLDTFM